MASFARTTFQAHFRGATAFGKKHPLFFGAFVAGLKTSLADVVVQTKIERREKIDYRRTTFFGLWGVGWLGGVQYLIYVKAFSRWFPSAERFAAASLRQKWADKVGQVNVLKQVFFDQFLHHPFLLYPALYTWKTAIESDFQLGGFKLVEKALDRYRGNCYEDLMLTWKIWIPAFLVNFSICPMWLRVPFVAGVSFFFFMAFSFLRGDPESDSAGCEREAVV